MTEFTDVIVHNLLTAFNVTIGGAVTLTGPAAPGGMTSTTSLTATVFNDKDPAIFVQQLGQGPILSAHCLQNDIEAHFGGKDPDFSQCAGVYAQSNNQGIIGATTTSGEFSTGVYGYSRTGAGIGVRGETSTGVAVMGRTFGSGLAGKFIGNVEATGTLSSGVINTGNITSADINCGHITCRDRSTITCFDVSIVGADCAEHFDIADYDNADPGTVMAINDDGLLTPCKEAYDKRVAGVVSGAGSFSPGIVLDKRGPTDRRRPIALVGKVYCKVDANYGTIEIGDLLTSSATLGHAMKASDPTKAFGAVIGKALQSFRQGKGLVPILIALQ